MVGRAGAWEWGRDSLGRGGTERGSSEEMPPLKVGWALDGTPWWPKAGVPSAWLHSTISQGVSHSSSCSGPVKPVTPRYLGVAWESACEAPQTVLRCSQMEENSAVIY